MSNSSVHHQVNGRLYPKALKLESIKNVSTIEARDDDILLATYPKSGTHWMYEIIRFLLAGTTDLPKEKKRVTMIEAVPPSQLDNMKGRRILNSHNDPDIISSSFFDKKCKIVNIMRNPRDVFVSYYYDMKNVRGNFTGEWKDAFDLLMDNQVAFGNWIDFTKTWDKFVKSHPDLPILVLTYEEMNKDLLGSVTQVAEFIGLEMTKEFLQEITDKTEFDSMAKRWRDPNDKQTQIYRKGKVGDWKNLFTVAQSERFDEMFEKEMSGTQAYNLYSNIRNGNDEYFLEHFNRCSSVLIDELQKN